MAGNSVFIPVRERGWQHGLGNLLRAGFSQWWKTRLGWVQTLIWTVAINFLLGSILWSGLADETVNAPMMYSLFTGMFAAVAVVIILQDAIVGEKQSGTAAWVLSKPVSRTAFIVSKIIPNALGVLVTVVLIPGAVAYLQIALATGQPIPALSFLAAQGILWLNLVFYLALTLMLGTLFNHRGPVIGLALAFLFGQQYLIGLYNPLVTVLPYTLAVPIDLQYKSLAAALMLGEAPHSWLPVISSSILTFVFIAISIWKFKREEF